MYNSEIPDYSYPLSQSMHDLREATARLAEATRKLSETGYRLARIALIGSEPAANSPEPDGASVSGTGHGSDSPLASSFIEAPGPQDDFFAIGTDSSVRFRDPLSRRLIQPGEIPEGLLYDPELRKGFDFWKAHGTEVPVRLLLVSQKSHHSLAIAGVDLQLEAQRLAEAGGILFIEGCGFMQWQNKLEEIVYNLYSHADRNPEEPTRASLRFTEQDSPDNGFEFELLRKIMGTGANIAIPDFREGSTHLADSMLKKYYQDTNYLRGIMGSGRAGSPGEARDKFIEYQSRILWFLNYHGPYLAGRMGAALARQHETTGALPRGATLLAGPMYKHMKAVFNALGPGVTCIGEPTDKSDLVLLDCLRRGEITMHHKARLIEIEVFKRFGL